MSEKEIQPPNIQPSYRGLPMRCDVQVGMAQSTLGGVPKVQTNSLPLESRNKRTNKDPNPMTTPNKTLEELARRCTVDLLNSDRRFPVDMETQLSMERIILDALLEAQKMDRERTEAELDKWKEHDETLCDLLGDILNSFRILQKDREPISAQYWIDHIEQEMKAAGKLKATVKQSTAQPVTDNPVEDEFYERNDPRKEGEK